MLLLMHAGFMGYPSHSEIETEKQDVKFLMKCIGLEYDARVHRFDSNHSYSSLVVVAEWRFQTLVSKVLVRHSPLHHTGNLVSCLVGESLAI